MFLGLTIANIGGVPAATWIGQRFGWRQVFAITAIFGVITMVGLAAALPKGGSGQRLDVVAELKVMIRPDVVLPTLTTVLMGASDGFVTLALVLIGVGFTIGNWIGGVAGEEGLVPQPHLRLSCRAFGAAFSF